VLKVERTTTKLQVVFDGSPKSTSGYSLNDLLYAGPFVQPKTCTNLLRFDFLKLRCAETSAKCIVAFEFLQWRDRHGDEIGVYLLDTIAYVTKPAAFWQLVQCSSRPVMKEWSFY